MRDKSSRESLLTQVLYSAGSLGRLGGDFSLILALLEEGDGDADGDGDGEGDGAGRSTIEDGDGDRDEDVKSNPPGDKNPTPNPSDEQHTRPTDAIKEEKTKQPEKRPEWVETMKKHRVLAGKLELLASGAGGKGSILQSNPT